MKYKYVVLDFGKVIAGPATGDWDITPRFLELIDMEKVDKDKLYKAIKKYEHLLGTPMDTLEQEYDMFLEFYDGIISEMGYPDYDRSVVEKIAYDRTYKFSKYSLYDCIYDELNKLKKKYTLILLTDNWPCVNDYLREYKLEKYFDKVYISSIYGCEKKDKVFFDYPIKDYDIKPGEALFIDDTEINLDAAVEKGFDVLLMDRYKENKESKYKIINDLSDI